MGLWIRASPNTPLWPTDELSLIQLPTDRAHTSPFLPRSLPTVILLSPELPGSHLAAAWNTLRTVPQQSPPSSSNPEVTLQAASAFPQGEASPHSALCSPKHCSHLSRAVWEPQDSTNPHGIH